MEALPKILIIFSAVVAVAVASWLFVECWVKPNEADELNRKQSKS